MLPKPDFEPAADAVFYVPSEQLLAPPPARRVKANPAPKKRKASKWDIEDFELYDGHEGLLVRTMLVRSSAHAHEREPVVVTHPAIVLQLCKHLTHSDQERMVVLALNAQNAVVAIYEVSIGTSTATMASAVDILKIPMLTGCRGFIVVHNHPGGSKTQSKEDVALTAKLADGARCIGLNLLDHIIVARSGYTSFLELGLITQ